MRKAVKFDPQGAGTAPEGAGGDAQETAEASENAPQVPAGGAASPALPLPAHDLPDRLTGLPAAVPGSGPDRPSSAREDIPGEAQGAAEALDNAAHAADLGAGAYALSVRGTDRRSAAPQAPGPSDPKRRSSADPGNRAEAAASDAWGSDPAGAPSPAPPFPARGLHGGLTSLQGAGPDRAADLLKAVSDEAQGASGASESEAPPAPGLDGSRGPPARRGQAAAPNALALFALVGADGGPAPADGEARSGSKRGSHGGVRDGAEAGSRKARRRRSRLPARPLPCSRPPGVSAAAWRRWRRPPRPTPARRKPTTPSAPTPPTGEMFASWLRRQGLPETPPDPEAVGLYLAAQVERGGAELSVATLERRLSGHRLALPADRRSRSTSGTAISRPCSPASAAATAALPCRRPPSSPTSFWPCWRRWRWT